MKTKTIVVAFVLAAGMALADTTPVMVSFLDPAQFPSAKYDVMGIRLSAWHGSCQNFTGLDIGLAQRAKGDFWGIAAGGLNQVDGSAYGVQIGGLLNVATNDVYGIQIAGIGNGIDPDIARNVYGAQIGSIANVSDRMYGLQIGLLNVAKGEVYGLQIGDANLDWERFSLKDLIGGFGFDYENNIVVKFARLRCNDIHYMYGMQIGGGNLANNTYGMQIGVVNLVSGDMSGSQIGGLINVVVKNLNGVQICGLLNYAEDVRGMQIGGGDCLIRPLI